MNTKKLLFSLAFALMSFLGWGQVTLPHHDPINYTVGQGLQTQTGWTSLNTGDALLISSGNLTYTGLSASSGNKVTFDGAGIDAAKLFTQQTSGTVYYSFLLNITSLGSLNTTGGYFTSFTEGAGTAFGGTVWLRSDGTGYDIGINPRTTAANTVWSSGTQTINTTLFVVISYQIVSGTSNDVVNLWINPTPGSSMPAATHSATNLDTDLANLNRILLRQDTASTTPYVEMDELRVGTTWADVTPAGATINLLASPSSLSGFNYIETAGPSVSQNFVLSGTNLNGTNVVLTAPTNYEISTDNSNFSGSHTFTAYNGSNQTIYVRLKAGLIAGNYNSENITIAGGGDTDGAGVSCSGTVTPLTISFNVATASVSENGVNYTITATSNAMGSHTADIVVTGGTATNGNQYTFTTATATFAASMIYTTNVTINNNSVCASATNTIFGLSGLSTGLTLGANTSLTLTINDDDLIIGNQYVQDFDGTTPVWTYTGSGSVATTYGKTNNGIRIGETQSFTLNNVSTVGMNNLKLLLNDASVGGIENNDALKIYVALNGSSFSSTPDIQIQEGNPSDNNYNKSWTYSANNTAATTAGTPATFTGDGVNGYAKVEITIPNGTTSISVKIESANTATDEYYYIDDIRLYGEICNICSEPTTHAVFHNNSPQSITGTSVTLNWTNGNGTNRVVLIKEANAISFVPTDGNTYSANANFSSGTALSDGSKVVYNGSASTANITGLTPGTIYYATIYEYGCTAGNENYFTSGTPTTDIFVTTPNNPATFTEGCVSSNTIQLNWTTPAVGNFQGYLLTVRQGAVPSAVNTIDPSTISTANTNFSLAGAYGTSSFYLYKGNGTTATISGLTQGQSYTFKLYTYTDAGDVFEYAIGTQTSQIINLANVTSPSASGSNNSVSLGWTNPSVGCFDEILIVANLASGITFTPSGDGTAYTANSVYAGNNSIVYKGSGNTLNVTGLTNGTTYYFEIFVRKGTEWSSGIEVAATPNTSTILEAGDLAIVAVNTSAESSGSSDEITFVCFKDITPGTQIFFTDNGYERVTAGLWGDTEGIVSIKRKNSTLAKGTFITIHSNNGGINGSEDFTIRVCGLADDNNWEKSVDNTSNFFDLNKDDQVWFMQGGTWLNTSDSTSHNATYTGNVLYGWTDIPWKTAPNYASTDGSTIVPGFNCYTTDVNNSQTGFSRLKFADPDDPDFSSTTRDQLDWIALINTDSNWTEFSSDPNYDSGGYDYYGHACPGLTVAVDTHIDGKWIGTKDTNWFNCANWDYLRVPNETVDVIISTSAIKESIVSASAAQSDLYGDIAKAKNLTIQSNLWVEANTSSDVIEVHGNLTIENNALLDLNGGGTDGGVLKLSGNWIDNYSATDDGFYETNSTVHFVGTSPQTVTCSGGTEHFYNVVLNNPIGFTTDSFNNDLHAEGNLTLSQGNLTVKTWHYALAAKDLSVAAGSQIMVEDKGSLIQTDDNGMVSGGDANAYKIEKTTGAYYNYDYIYWSSPVENLNIQDVFSTANGFNNYKYKFVPQEYNDQHSGIRTGVAQTGVGADGFDDEGDDWTAFSSGVMTTGLGYIVMGQGSPTSFSVGAIGINHTGYTVNFTGQKVNNGSIDVVIYKDKYNLNGYTDYNSYNINLNLVGNPYPSAISTGELYKDNKDNIDPNFYFWTHAQQISNSFTGPWAYNFSNNSFASATVDIGTYGVTTNALNTGLIGLDYQYIASGQAFFVQAKSDIVSGTQLNFNNSMRGVTNTNDSFRRVGNQDSLNRIWLSMSEPDGTKNGIAVGFSNANTDGLSANDVYRIDSGNDTEFYSVIPDTQGDFDIQFLSTFSEDKTIPLGMEILTNGTFSIQVEQTEGVFLSGQTIYLEDTYQDIIHDLSASAYTFTQTAGENINDRFILRFTNSALSNEETALNEVKVYPNPSTGLFNVAYYGIATLQYTVYDLTGKTVFSGTGNQINLSQQALGLYFAKITDGKSVRTVKLVRE